MDHSTTCSSAQRWLLCLLVALALLAAPSGGIAGAHAANDPILAADGAAPLFCGLLQDVVGNRTRLIQMSFVFILIGIFILWKK